MSTVQRDTSCWVVKEIPTQPYQHAYPEPDAHFDTLTEAEAHLRGLGVDGCIVPEAHPCWLAKCGRCGQPLGGDEFDEAHYDSKREAEFHDAEIDDHCDLEGS